MLVPACIHVGAQPFLDRYEEGQGRLSDPISAAVPTHPWPPLTKHVDPVQVNNATPSEAEVEKEVCCQIPLKAGERTRLRAEHFKQWL